MPASCTDRNGRLRVDPTAWAARRKEAMERARSRREHRIYNDNDDDVCSRNDALEDEISCHSRKQRMHYQQQHTPDNYKTASDIDDHNIQKEYYTDLRARTQRQSYRAEDEALMEEMSRHSSHHRRQEKQPGRGKTSLSQNVTSPSSHSKMNHHRQLQSQEQGSPLSLSLRSFGSSFPLQNEGNRAAGFERQPREKHSQKRVLNEYYQRDKEMNLVDEEMSSNLKNKGNISDNKTNWKERNKGTNFIPDRQVRDNVPTDRPPRGRGRGRGRTQNMRSVFQNQDNINGPHLYPDSSINASQHRAEIFDNPKEHSYANQSNQSLPSRKSSLASDVMQDASIPIHVPGKENIDIQSISSKQYKLTSPQATNESSKLALLKMRMLFRERYLRLSQSSNTHHPPDFPWVLRFEKSSTSRTSLETNTVVNTEQSRQRNQQSYPKQGTSNKFDTSHENGHHNSSLVNDEILDEKKQRELAKRTCTAHNPDSNLDYSERKVTELSKYDQGQDHDYHKENNFDDLDDIDSTCEQCTRQTRSNPKYQRDDTNQLEPHHVGQFSPDNLIESNHNIKNENEEVVDIDMIHCNHCQKSFAPPTYQKICGTLDNTGKPKCISMYHSKRKVFSSAKARIVNNQHLNKDEQKAVISARKKVVSQLKSGSMKKTRLSKWREQSDTFRDAMRTNRLIAKAQQEGKPVDYYL